MEVANAKARGEAYAAVRREAVVPYLKALATLYDHGMPESKPELPSARVLPTFGTPQAKAAYKVYSEECEKIKLCRDMCDLAHVPTNKILALYNNSPLATEELHQLAKEILKDDAAVERLVSKVRRNTPTDQRPEPEASPATRTTTGK